jgi:hypothetical protein
MSLHHAFQGFPYHFFVVTNQHSLSAILSACLGSGLPTSINL